ncbi:MAG TPA: DUF362 domain-containing protein [Bryobacteraceae bacterium]|jgi:hypothetical protein|nr:DUF362 domain-containing protein [Bryobacteraceae bacterium]
MPSHRREFLQAAVAGAVFAHSRSKAANTATGMPGPYPGRVIAVEHSGCIASGAYQPEAIQQMMQRGMAELTGAPSWQDAWRTLFEKGDVVGIKVSPVGGPGLCSDSSVLHSILDGLNAAGVSNQNVIVFSRYREEVLDCGIDKWLRPGVHWDAPSLRYDDVQLDMGGYDENHYMQIALIKPGENWSDPHFQRSYVSKIVTNRVNKIINLPVLKHHQSAGVTICLKNMSHGFVNNVNRSHLTPTLNACGMFIPSVVSLPIIRQKVALQIVDAVKASYHGGPGGKPQYIWEPKTLYFGTDPVALDKTGWKAIDAKRQQMGMAPIALSRPDKDSHFLNCQVEHIEIAGMLQLGEFSNDKIHVKQVRLA